MFCVEVTFEWYESASVFIFTFCLKTRVRENKWIRKTSIAAMVNFFSKVSFQKCLITSMFKVLSQELRLTLTKPFERHLAIVDFTDMDQHRYRACTKTSDLLLCCFFVKVYKHKMLLYFHFPWNISTCLLRKLATFIILSNLHIVSSC